MSPVVQRLLLSWLITLPLIAQAEAPLDLPSTTSGLGMSLAKDGSLLALSGYDSPSGTVKFHYLNGTEWASETIENGVGVVPSVAVDSSIQTTSQTSLVFVGSVPYIVYYSSNGSALRVARKVSSTWELSTIESGAQVGGSPSAARCGTNLCISYYDKASANLKFTRGLPGNWSTSTIDAAPEAVGSHSALAVLPSGLCAIVYYDATNKRPKLAYEIALNSWTIETIPSSGYAWGLYPSLVAATDGTLHLAASRYKAPSMSHELVVYYAKRDPSSNWSVSVVSSDYAGGPTSILLNPSQLPLVAYRKSIAHYSTTTRYVELSQLQGSGVWNRSLYSPASGAEGNSLRYEQIALRPESNGTTTLAYAYKKSSAGIADSFGVRLHTTQQGSGSSSSSSSAGGGPGPVPRLADTDNDGTPDILDNDDDNDGLSDADEAQYGTDPLVSDSDGDGITDGEETEDGTNPTDRGSNVPVLDTSFCVEWDSALGEKALLHQKNNSSSAVEIINTKYDSRGRQANTVRFTLPANKERNMFLFEQSIKKVASYGRICTTHSSTRGAIETEILYYRKTGRSKKLSLSATVSARNGVKGSQLLTISNSPPEGIANVKRVTNSVVLSNLADQQSTGELKLYSRSGELLETIPLTLSANGSATYFPTPNRTIEIGEIQWVPVHSEFAHYLRNFREIYLNPKKKGDPTRRRIQVNGAAGSGEPVALPVNTTGHSSIVELANATDETQTIAIQVSNQAERMVTSFSITLEPHGSERLVVRDILGKNRRGVFHIDGSIRSGLYTTATQLPIASSASVRRQVATMPPS